MNITEIIVKHITANTLSVVDGPYRFQSPVTLYELLDIYIKNDWLLLLDDYKYCGWSCGNIPIMNKYNIIGYTFRVYSLIDNHLLTIHFKDMGYDTLKYLLKKHNKRVSKIYQKKFMSKGLIRQSRPCIGHYGHYESRYIIHYGMRNYIIDFVNVEMTVQKQISKVTTKVTADKPINMYIISSNNYIPDYIAYKLLRVDKNPLVKAYTDNHIKETLHTYLIATISLERPSAIQEVESIWANVKDIKLTNINYGKSINILPIYTKSEED